MNITETDIVHRFIHAETNEDLEGIRKSIADGGYSSFNQLLEYIKQQLKICSETEWSRVQQEIDKARKLVPIPGGISPAWEYIWDDVTNWLHYKQEMLSKVSAEQRDGEWQVLIDNPFTHQQIVCYPGLSFIEAAWIYAYFRNDLQKNEYIRVQKVVDVLVIEGK